MERRIITHAEHEYQRIGSTRIAPGIWEDAEGGLHFSIPELLALVDLEDIPENREAVFAIVKELAEAHFPDTQFIRQDPA